MSPLHTLLRSGGGGGRGKTRIIREQTQASLGPNFTSKKDPERKPTKLIHFMKGSGQLFRPGSPFPPGSRKRTDRTGPSLSAHRAQDTLQAPSSGPQRGKETRPAPQKPEPTTLLTASQIFLLMGGRGEAGTRGRGGQREPERSRRRQRQPSPPEYPPCWGISLTTWASPGQGTSVLCHHPVGRWSPWSQQARWACSGQLQPFASTCQPRGSQLDCPPEAGDGAGERSGPRAAALRPQPAGGRQSACRMGQQLRNHLPTTPSP